MDMLKIGDINPSFFVSAESGEAMAADTELAVEIKKQLPEGVSEEELNSSTQRFMITILVFVALTLLVLFYFQELINRHYFWSMFFPLQLLSFLSFYDLPQPANVELYFSEIELASKLGILNFEWFGRILDPTFRYKDWFFSQEDRA